MTCHLPELAALATFTGIAFLACFLLGILAALGWYAMMTKNGN